MLGGRTFAALRRPARPTWLTSSRRPVVGSILAGVFGQAVLVVTGVIVARALGPADRGYLAFLFLLESVVRQVGALGLPASTTYFVARNRAHAYDVVRAMRAPALVQASALTVIQAILLWVLIADEPERVWVAGLITVALLPAALGTDYGLAQLQGQGRFRAFNVFRMLPVGAYGVLVVFFFAIDKAGIISITVAAVLSVVAFAAVILRVALRELRPAPSTEQPPSRRQIFRFGLKGYIGTLSPNETFRLDQAAVGLFLAPVDLGLYVVALSITNLPRFIAQSIGAIAFPRAAHDVDGRRTMWRFTGFTAVVSAAIVVPLGLAAGSLVPFFFGAEFADSVTVARILLVGAFFYAVRRVLMDGARGIGAPGIGSIAELASWVSLVLLLAILMPPFDLLGVAAAIALSSALSLAVLVVALLCARVTGSTISSEPFVVSSTTVDAGLLGRDS